MEADKVLKKITDDYDKKVAAKELLKAKDIAAKTGLERMRLARKIAEQTGMTAEQVLIKNLLAVYPDGVVPEADLAKYVVGTLKHNYEFVSPVAAQAQAAVNESLGVGLKPVVPKFDVEGAEAIAKDLAKFETVADDGNLAKQIANHSMKVVDRSIQANAAAHQGAGFEVRVIRVYDGKGVHYRKDPCEWCLDREGEWSYSEAQANGVFERHPGCGCDIYYETNMGYWQHSNEQSTWRDVNDNQFDLIEKRIKYQPKKRG